MSHLLIIGCGRIGIDLADQLANSQPQLAISGVRRHIEALPSTIEPIASCAQQLSLAQIPADTSQVVYCVAAGERSASAYQRAYIDGLDHCLSLFAKADAPKISRFIFVSSTAVYGQAHGEWVDEYSVCLPRQFNGQYLAIAEQLVSRSELPTVILRFSGIYGPNRRYFVDGVRAGRIVVNNRQDHYTNRIHQHDCAGVLAHVLLLATPPPLLVASDHQPVLRNTMIDYLNGVEPASSQPSVVMGKRCHNQRLLASGYQFKYPDYRSGYAEG